MISPIAPLFASECWSKFLSVPNRIDTDAIHVNWEKDVVEQRWPSVDQDIEDIMVIKVYYRISIKIFEIFHEITQKISEFESIFSLFSNNKTFFPSFFFFR